MSGFCSACSNISMDLEVSPTERLEGVLRAPPSKSYTHRAVILGGLSRGTVLVDGPLLSADTRATMEAMRAAGAEVEVEDDRLVVRGNGGEIKAPKLVDVRNSGTTIRIMASIFSLCGEKVMLTGDESIRKRPMGPLLEALEGAGVKTSSKGGKPPVSVRGPMTGGLIRIRGDVSSQYISGLLIACPLRGSDTTVEITTPLKSRPYLDMTLEAMEAFGARVENQAYRRLRVPGNQFYSSNEYAVEGDYSGAAFVLGASALTDSAVTVTNLREGSSQGDRHFLELLKMMDAQVKTQDDEVTVTGGKSLRGIDADLSQTPDLLPITAAMCALAEGRSTLYNVEHARIKECDRISAMAQGLARMGADVQERKDGLIIDGSGSLRGAEIEGFGDHRIVMAFAVAGLGAQGKTRISGAESVEVSYPGFVEDMKSLGARIKTSG